MSKIKLVVCGLEGRMGAAISELVEQNDAIELIGSFEKLKSTQDAVDCVIDFSSPDGFSESLSWCVETGSAFVSGTTGLSNADFETLNKASANIPVLWAPNMSLGIQWMTQVLKQFASLKNDFEFQMEELHHKHKVDAPSGTAIHLQKHLQEAVSGKAEEPVAIRGGGIFGIHKVFAMGEEETITLEHTALNRKVFARGALKAAEWIVSQKAGRYEMSQVLGF